MTNSKYLQKLLLFFAAFVFNESIIINYLSAEGFYNLSSAISYWSVAIVFILSLLIILVEKDNRKALIITTVILLLTVYYEKVVDDYNTVSDYSTKYLTHGIAGLAIGLAIKDIRQFIVYNCFFSTMLLIIFISEPINHKMLGLNEMTTGYMMSQILIFSLLGYFTVYNKNKLFLYFNILLSGIIILFSSRGCGISILLSWLFMYIWRKHYNGETIGKTIWKLGAICLLCYFALSYIASTLISSNINLTTGSFIEKLASGYADSSNGRDEIWTMAGSFISQYWLYGIGFGGDRIVFDYVFVHNVILEIFIDFGIPIGILLLFAYWKPIIKSIQTRWSSIIAITILALVFRTWVQLLFSSSYLDSMLGIMLILGMSINKKYQPYQNNN